MPETRVGVKKTARRPTMAAPTAGIPMNASVMRRKTAR